MIARSGRLRITWLTAALLLITGACSDPIVDEGAQPSELILMTHDSFALSEGTLEAFTEETGITVTVLRSLAIASEAGTAKSATLAKNISKSRMRRPARALMEPP